MLGLGIGIGFRRGRLRQHTPIVTSGNLTLTAEMTSLTMTFEAMTPVVDRVLPADQASLTLNTQAANLTIQTVGGSATTLNPSDKAGTVSLDPTNLIMTNSGLGGVRSVASHSTGKYHFKFTPGVTEFSYDHFVGLANADASLTADPATDANIIGLFNGDETVYVGGVNAGSGGITYQQYLGDFVEIEVDLDAKLWFSRLNGTGDWNGNPSANPATGVGGVSFASMSGPFYVYAYNASNNGVNTLDFSASGASSGYGSF